MKAPTLDLNEEELRALLSSEEANSFTIPLLLTQFKSTTDKSGSEALVLDVIINTDFYENKVRFSELYKTFLITVSLETIERDKYNALIDKNDWILLKNKKYQEFSDNNINNNYNINDKSGDKSLVNDLSALLNINDINGGNDGFDYEEVITNGKKFNRNIANSIEGNDGPKTGSVFSQETETTINDSYEDEGVVSADQIQGQTKALTPKFKLKFDVMNNCLNGQLILPSISDSNEIDFRIGEDRIVLNASNYKLDIFIPLLIKADEVITTFDTFTHILDVKMPLF